MRGNGEVFHNTMQYQLSRMQNQSILVAMNELSNHDHSRFMTRTNGMAGRIAIAGAEAANENVKKAIFKQGVVMQMTLPGAPTLYYGDEAGVCGWTDPDNRRTYPWGKEDFELIEFYRDMIFIHNHCDELKKGSYKQLDWGNNYLSYGRFDALNGTVTAINTSDHEINVKIPVWQLNIPNGNVMERLMETSEELYNVGRIPVMVENGDIAVTIPACSAVVYRTK